MKHILLIASIFLSAGACQTGLTKDPYVWERVKRVSVVDSDRRVRYPSITRTANGSLVVLYTRQDVDQEGAGVGDLIAVQSTDEGDTWSSGTVLFSGETGEPRSVNTLTTLRNGCIIAPFTELSDEQKVSTVRLLSSDDEGETWQVREVQADSPLVWWAPCGTVIQASEGVLVMPVFGAASGDDLRATIHSCGLLRSRDGGVTWGNFSWIARGPGAVYGAAGNRRFSFQGLSVQVLPGSDRELGWLALVTARRLNREATGPTAPDEGPGAPQLLCRLWSTDEGRTWSRPDQLSPGAWPALAVVGHQVLCAATTWAAWGDMRLMISRDGFRSLHQMLDVTTRGWIRGRVNNPHEAPLPPTVPFLGHEWIYEHYGFPSALALDEDNVVVVFNRPQRGESQIEGEENRQIPWEHERVQAVFYRRIESPEALAPPLEAEPKASRGRWILSERMIVPNINGPMMQGPKGRIIAVISDRLHRSDDGGRSWQLMEGASLPDRVSALGILQNGDWLASVVTVNQEWQSGRSTQMGSVGGYPTFKLEGESYHTHLAVWRSGDSGRTWAPSEPYKGPFKWLLPTVSHFLEGSDGSIALPVFGCLTDEEMSSYSASNGVIRSHDGGKTWGDFSLVFRTQPPGPGDYQPEPRYSEMDIVPLVNGHWVAFSRNERITMGPAGWGATTVALSVDLGRSWQPTGGSLVGVSQQKGLALPDGGMALTYRCHSWQQPGVAISYDEGRSFDYLLTGPYETVNAFLFGDSEFIVFSGSSHRSDSSAAIFRWTAQE